MNNQIPYKNSDFTKTGIARLFNFVFLKKTEGKVENEEFIRADGSREKIQKTSFIDMWIFGGWGMVAVICLFFLSQKYITTNLDIRLSLDLLVSGIFGLAWVYAAKGYSRAEIEEYRQMEIKDLDSKKIGLVTMAVVIGLFLFGRHFNIFFGAIFTTFVFFETLLRFVRRDYLNFRKLSDGSILFLSPQKLVPKKSIFIGLSSLALCIGAYGAGVYLVGEWKVKKTEEQKIAIEENNLRIINLQKRAESNGSAFIVDVYSN